MNGYSKRLLMAIILFVIAPMLFAVLIYVFFRTELPPVLLSFLNEFGIEQDSWTAIKLSRESEWFVFNLPDGLWAFSFTSFIAIVSSRDKQIIYWMSVLSVLGVMIVLEVLQGSLFAGTYDLNDVIAILIGFLSALLLTSLLLMKNNRI